VKWLVFFVGYAVALRFSIALAGSNVLPGPKYDPLLVDSGFQVLVKDVTVHDGARDRDIPLRIYLPKAASSSPVVLFSHGLGGSREGSSFLGQQWSARGYVAVFVQHPGSDDSVWRDQPPGERMGAVERAASLKNFMSRVQDVPAVLNQLGIWNVAKTNLLAGRMDLSKVGMSGHSFGAITTEAVSGEVFPIRGQELTDSRIKAAIVFSPSTSRSLPAEKAFGSVTVPWLLMTGTKDVALVGNMDVKSRLEVYPALHGGPKYEIVLHDAEHFVFTDRGLRGNAHPLNPNHHRVILALSTAFWDAYLGGNADALDWLKSPGPRSVMEPQDQWRFEAR
jgi:predicted dienelactone hydrolase